MFNLFGDNGPPFEHDLYPVVEIPDVITEHGRYYTTPDGAVYPSVTTVIGRQAGKQHLDAWRKRVGEAAANKVTKQAQVRGRAVHHLAEQFVLNNPEWAKGAMPANLYTFKPCIPVLREHVTKVLGIEFPLWSHVLHTAGRADLVCEWDGEAAILDFKTSRKEKATDQIKRYFLQKTTYARMFEERTGREIKKIVTLMPVDHEPKPSVWVKERKEFDEEVLNVFARRCITADPHLLLPGGVRP